MFKTNARTLSVALTRALPLIERRNTIPILGTVRLRTEAGGLMISATDLNAQLDVDALVDPLGPSAEIAVDPRRMLALLRLLPRTETVEVCIDGESIVMSWDGVRCRIGALSAAEFPEMDLKALRASGPLETAAIDAVRRVFPFVSREETRYYLMGVCLDDALAVATDGRRLAVMPGGASLKAVLAPCDGARIIVPRDVVALWLATAERGDVSLTVHGEQCQQIAIAGEHVLLKAKVIDGTYPDWRRVIPKTDAGYAAVALPRGPLLRAIAMVRACGAGGGGNMGALVFDGARAQLQLKGFGGAGEIACDIGPAQAKPTTLGVNPYLLAAGVEATRGKVVTVRFEEGVEPGGAVALTGSDALDGEHVVIMPLRNVERASFTAPALVEQAA